jgi:hypothetical protein
VERIPEPLKEKDPAEEQQKALGSRRAMTFGMQHTCLRRRRETGAP